MKFVKFFTALLFCLALSLTCQNAQAASEGEVLQPAAPGEAVKVGDVGRYFDEYSSYIQLSTALHSSETMHLPDVHIGGQGVGGVTYFNGTIINETTDPETGADKAVTIGDNLNVMGYIFRDKPGTGIDNRPVLIGDGLSPALDDSNSLGEDTRRWQDLYVSDNIYGSDVIHEPNLSVTNSASANQLLAYAGNNNFKWVNATSVLGSTTTRSDGSDAKEGDVILGDDEDGDGDVDIFVAGSIDDLLSTLLCEDGEFISYQSSSTPSWVCTTITTVIDDARASDFVFHADTVDGEFDGTPRNLIFKAGITSTTQTCTGSIYKSYGHVEFDTAYTNPYSINATYYTENSPTPTENGYAWPIYTEKDGDGTGFTIYGCMPADASINWQTTGY